MLEFHTAWYLLQPFSPHFFIISRLLFFIPDLSCSSYDCTCFLWDLSVSGILVELGQMWITLTQNLGPDSFILWPPGLWHGHRCSWACGPWLQRRRKERCQVRCRLSSSGSLLRRQVLKEQLSTIHTMCSLWGQPSRKNERIRDFALVSFYWEARPRSAWPFWLSFWNSLCWVFYLKHFWWNVGVFPLRDGGTNSFLCVKEVGVVLRLWTVEQRSVPAESQ